MKTKHEVDKVALWNHGPGGIGAKSLIDYDLYSTPINRFLRGGFLILFFLKREKSSFTTCLILFRIYFLL